MSPAGPPSAAASLPFDARPLVEPVDREAVRAYARALRARGGAGGAALTVVIVVIAVAVGAAALVIALLLLVGVIVEFAAQRPPVTPVGVVMTALPLLVLAGLALAVTTTVRRAMKEGEREYRLDRFARANGMTYVSGMPEPGLPGMIFGLGTSRSSSDLVRGDRPRFVEFGNYSYVTGTGKSRTTHRWGYVAVRLDVPLPNIVLDATGNDGIFGTNLPASFDGSQRLGLEGDFDRYFSLYCPAGYERDALYLFTPDIMARFVDNAAALDVEIVDDWLFLYGKRPFSTLDPATWAWLFSVVAALLDKLAQWGRWRDDRLAGAASAPSAPDAAVDPAVGGGTAVPFAAPATALSPPPGVAPAGRRLTRRKAWWGAVVVAGIMLILWFWDAIAGLLGVPG